MGKSVTVGTELVVTLIPQLVDIPPNLADKFQPSLVPRLRTDEVLTSSAPFPQHQYNFFPGHHIAPEGAGNTRVPSPLDCPQNRGFQQVLEGRPRNTQTRPRSRSPLREAGHAVAGAARRQCRGWSNTDIGDPDNIWWAAGRGDRGKRLTRILLFQIVRLVREDCTAQQPALVFVICGVVYYTTSPAPPAFSMM